MEQLPGQRAYAHWGIERVFELLLNLWSTKWPKPSTRILFALLLGSICVTTFFIGAVPTFKFGHDDFFLLENGWRATQGQRPQLDYFSPWGPITFLIAGFGLELANYSPNGIGYANSVVALLTGVWAYWLGKNRCVCSARVIIGLYAALLICSPYPLGGSPFMSSHAMLYNRYGYALVILVMLECFTQDAEMKRGSEYFSGGVSTGVAMAIALFLKASFFAVSIPLVVVSLVFWRFNPKRIFGIFLGFGVVVLACMAYMRFDFAGVLHALQMAAGARSETLSPKMPIWTIEATLSTLGLVISLGIGASFLTQGASKSSASGARSWFGKLPVSLMVALLVYLVDIVLLATNAQGSALPLLPAWGLVVGSQLALSRRQSSPSELYNNLPYHASLLVMCGVLLLPQFASEAIGLSTGALRKAHPSREMCAVRFDEPRLADLILCDHPANKQVNANGSIYTTAVNEGAALLRLNAKPTDKILTMDMQNPFPYALGWPPPHGGIASASFNYTFSARYRPTFDAYFGDATVVMLPKQPAQTPEYIDGFYEIYLPALFERFQLAAESGQWRLYRTR